MNPATPGKPATPGTSATPPLAKRIPKQDEIHGDLRIDEYFWMREKSNPEVIAYLEAENAYTDAVLEPTRELQETLYQEMLGRIQETDSSVPVRRGDFLYYTRTEEGKQYPLYCRKKGDPDAAEAVILDLNHLAEGHSYLGLGAFEVSDDGRLLAYSTDTTGFRVYTLFVKNMETGELLPDRMEKVNSIAWAADNRTLFYVTEDEAKRAYRFWRHRLGESDDSLLYEETDALFHLGAHRSRSKAFVFLASGSSDTSEVRCLPAGSPETDLRVLLPRETGHRYYADHRGDRFYLRTDKNAKNFRIVSAPMEDPRPENWTEIVPHDPAIMREDLDLFANHAVVSEREAGLEQLRVIDLRSGTQHRVTFPEPAYSIWLDQNPEFNTNQLRFRYQSFTTPVSVYEYNMDSRERVLLKETPVLGGFDRAQYVMERLEATAPDGVKVPVSLVYRKGTPKDGTAPLLLYGYGSYGFSTPVTFSSSRISLLDRGVIFAAAHIRGGGELGEEWRQAGKLKQKLNTFTDFISCADHLVKEHYTSSDRLAISGGSAGGLLMGAVTNLRPDLFRVVMAYVPFMDVLNTMLDESLPLTVGEYLEWGNPNIREDYEYMRTYCPYTNLARKAYPTMLVRASLNDSQVMYWEAAKYVAKLRAHKTDSNLLLLKTNMGAGHGGASGRYDALRDTAYDYAFLLTQLGINR